MSNQPIQKEIERAIITALRELPQQHNIRKVSLFGSCARGSVDKTSDVDLLVEFIEPASLFEMHDIEQVFSQSLNRPVDLTTPDGLSKHIKSQVLSEAQTLYEQGRSTSA